MTAWKDKHFFKRGGLVLIACVKYYNSAQRDNCIKLRWNQVIGNTNNGVVSLEDNAQVEANMNMVFSLIREDVAVAA